MSYLKVIKERWNKWTGVGVGVVICPVLKALYGAVPKLAFVKQKGVEFLREPKVVLFVFGIILIITLAIMCYAVLVYTSDKGG